MILRLLTRLQIKNISHNQDTLDVVLSVLDLDGDSLTVTAVAEAAASVAYQLDQQYNFYAHPGGEYLNFRGINEKYFKGDTGNFYILPNGEVYQWNGSIAASPLVGTVDPSHYADLSLIHSPAAPQALDPSDVALSVSGSTLTIDPDAAFAGSFRVTVSVTDGVATTEESFEVAVTNTAPTIDPVADQTISHNQDTLDVVLSVLDLDGDGLTVTATAEAAASLAYQLDQQYNFYAHPVGEISEFQRAQRKIFQGRYR